MAPTPYFVSKLGSAKSRLANEVLGQAPVWGWTLAETLSLAESLIRNPQKLAAETLALLDSLGKQTARAVVAETLALADQIVRNPQKVAAETLLLLESLGKSVTKLLTAGIVLADSLQKGAQKATSETLAIGDSIVRVIGKCWSDGISLTEAFSALKIFGDLRKFVVQWWTRLWAVAATEMMIFAESKKAGSTEDFELDWSTNLGSDTIVSSSWTVPSGLTVVQSENTGTASIVRLSGGTAGQNYKFTNTVVCASGQTKLQDINLPVN